MSWPELYSWTEGVLEEMSPGQKIILIADVRGGATATDRFYDMLDQDFVNIETFSLPSFPEFQDYASIFEKRP